MSTEIERKFLVRSDSWKRLVVAKHHIRQGYIAVGPPTAIRVRVVDAVKANLNIKKATLDIVRSEFEYAIPSEDAHDMLQHLCCGTVIEKTRHVVPDGEFRWEIDVFHGANEGLVLAEIEIPHVSAAIPTPDWLGDEVSGDPRYLNTYLTLHPFTTWEEMKKL